MGLYQFGAHNFCRVLRGLAAYIGATEAAAFRIRDAAGADDLETLAHLRGAADDADGAPYAAAAIVSFKDILRPCLALGRDGAIEVPGSADAAGSRQFCLVKRITRNGIAGAV